MIFEGTRTQCCVLRPARKRERRRRRERSSGCSSNAEAVGRTLGSGSIIACSTPCSSFDRPATYNREPVPSRLGPQSEN